MYFLYFILIVSLTQAYVLDDASKDLINGLKEPFITHVTALHPPGFRVQWTKLEIESNEIEPILGYKLRLWEIKNTTVYHYVIENGISVLKEDTKQKIKWPKDVHQVPEGEYKEQVFGPNNTEAEFKGLIYDTWYEIRALAYNKNGDGPLSKPVRSQIISKKD